jgi:hypothetical protein
MLLDKAGCFRGPEAIAEIKTVYIYRTAERTTIVVITKDYHAITL